MSNYKDEQWLKQKYWEEELTLKDMANLCDCHDKTILRWMKKYGIERRTIGEALSQIDYDNLECRDCGKNLPNPDYTLTVEESENRMCKKCKAEMSRKSGRIPMHRNASIEITEETKINHSSNCWLPT